MKDNKILISVLVVFGVLYWLGVVDFWYGNVKNYFDERSDTKYFQEIEKKSAELKRLYKEDIYGGETPEETWNLFVDALEKGDTDLASRYYVVEKQEQMRYEMSVAKEKGFIPLFLNDFLKIDSGTYYQNDNTRFQYVVIGTEGKWKGVVQLTYDLILNKETNKWKILDL